MWPPTLLCLVFLSMFTPMPSLFQCNSQTSQPSFHKPFPFSVIVPSLSCVLCTLCFNFCLYKHAIQCLHSAVPSHDLFLWTFECLLRFDIGLCLYLWKCVKKCIICLIWSKFPVRMSWRNPSIWNTDGYLRPPCWESCYSKSFSDCGWSNIDAWIPS